MAPSWTTHRTPTLVPAFDHINSKQSWPSKVSINWVVALYISRTSSPQAAPSSSFSIIFSIAETLCNYLLLLSSYCRETRKSELSLSSLSLSLSATTKSCRKLSKPPTVSNPYRDLSLVFVQKRKTPQRIPFLSCSLSAQPRKVSKKIETKKRKELMFLIHSATSRK